MADRIQIRRDTEANWSASNPVLALGEMGFVMDAATSSRLTDPIQFKVGDGSSSWISLPLQTTTKVLSVMYNGTYIEPVSGTVSIIPEVYGSTGSAGQFVYVDDGGHPTVSPYLASSFVSQSQIVQSVGTGNNNVMSQNAVSGALSLKEDSLSWMTTSSIETLWNNVFSGSI